MTVKLVSKSRAQKTTGIATTYRAGNTNKFDTCPSTCPFLDLHSKGTEKIDLEYTKALSQAVAPQGQSWLYTHFKVDQWIEIARKGKTIFNYSTDSIKQAIKFFNEKIPVVTVVSDTFWAENPAKRIIKDIVFLRCPAEINKKITCKNCGGETALCAKKNRKQIICFTEHGSQKKLANQRQGGCYAHSGFHTRIAWNNTLDEKSSLSDGDRVLAWSQTLRDETRIRFHVAGDLGLS